MLVARQVFQAKYGRGDELVTLFQEFNTRMQEVDGAFQPFRILTDASGPFFTVVTEVEVESLAAAPPGPRFVERQQLRRNRVLVHSGATLPSLPYAPQRLPPPRSALTYTPIED